MQGRLHRTRVVGPSTDRGQTPFAAGSGAQLPSHGDEQGLEAAAIVSVAEAVEQEGLAAVRDLTPSAPVHLAGPDGALRTTV